MGICKSQDLILTQADHCGPPARPRPDQRGPRTGRCQVHATLVPSSPILSCELTAGILPQPRREPSCSLEILQKQEALDVSLTLPPARDAS